MRAPCLHAWVRGAFTHPRQANQPQAFFSRSEASHPEPLVQSREACVRSCAVLCPLLPISKAEVLTAGSEASRQAFSLRGKQHLGALAALGAGLLGTNVIVGGVSCSPAGVAPTVGDDCPDPYTSPGNVESLADDKKPAEVPKKPAAAVPEPEKELFNRRRVIFLTGSVDEKVGRAVCAQLLFLDMTDSKTPITLFINSSGGTVTEGFAIYDTMQYISAPVHTHVIGQASSMAVLLVAGGAKGFRTASPNSRLMIHSPSNSINHLQVEDVIVRATELQEKKELLVQVLGKDTGCDLDVLRTMCGRNLYMSPERARELGIIDAIIIKRPDATAADIKNL